MQKYPIYIQDEEMACGVYCILMILKYYGYNEEIKEIKKKTRLNQNGVSIKGIIECFKEYQIEAKAYEASFNDIQEQVKLPCILYMINENVGHFVVLYEMKDDEYIVGDPAQGLVSMYIEDINEHYAQRMIAITHVGRVPDIHYQSYYHFLMTLFDSYRKYMLTLIYKGIWIAILSYMSSYFYQIIIDDIHQETKLFYMLVLSLTYGIIEMVKITVHKAKTKEMIRLTRAIDEDCVFQTSMNLFSLPYSFFYQDKGQIQSQLSTFYQLSETSIDYFGRAFLDGLMFIVFIVGMLWIQPIMTVCVCFMLIIISIFSYHYLQKLQHIHKHYLESHFKYQHHLLELIENQFLIRRFLLAQSTRERSYHIFLDESLTKEKQSLYISQFQHFMQYIIYIFHILIMMLGFYFFKRKNITLGQLLMFYMLMSYCIEPLLSMVEIFSEYKQTSLLYEKYKSFQPDQVTEKEDVKEKITSITLDNVGYSYGYSMPLFEHIDCHVYCHLLLKGQTGSGKSTLLKLLMGYDLNYIGDIYFNDQELRTINLESLYQHIGYVCQTPTFLHFSLLENFLCHDENKIKAYLKAFHQEDLISMFPVILDEDGSPLSLGQRQVVAMIRVLCQDYDIYIFDEAFSHMDVKLAGTIQRYLWSHDEGKIYIMVNHQTRTLKKGWNRLLLEKENKSLPRN